MLWNYNCVLINHIECKKLLNKILVREILDEDTKKYYFDIQ